MNRALSILLAVAAAVLLATGYTWRARFDEAHERSVYVRAEGRIQSAKVEGKPLSMGNPLEGFDEVADAQEKRTAELVGTVQYCMGWIVFGLAAVLWCLPVAKKVENTSC